MTVKGGTTPACAACKYQRRKCNPNCPLAPYFPATQPKTFQNVHRLFGVSNVTKTLERLTTKDEKEDAMKSIIFEADMRQRFPAHGCCIIIAHLRLQLHLAVNELRHVYSQLKACRDQFGIQNNGNSSNDLFLFDEPHEVKLLFNYDNDLSAIQAQLDGFGLHCPGDFGVDNFVSSCDSSPLEESKAGPGRRMELKTAAAGFILTTR